jgi:hypothetical protein
VSNTFQSFMTDFVDDPVVNIVWPEPVAALSGNDASWPPLSDRLLWLGERSA